MVGAGTTEDVRRANLAATLGILYRHGPVSRAGLSKRTGRNRSTIASLVSDLAELGLVVENEPDSLGQVGRPSPVVSVRGDVAAIAVNPEIDVLTIGLVGLDGLVRRVIRHEYDRIPTAAEVLSITAAVLAGMRRWPGMRAASRENREHRSQRNGVYQGRARPRCPTKSASTL